MNSHPRNLKCIVECNFQKKLYHDAAACCSVHVHIIYLHKLMTGVLQIVFCKLSKTNKKERDDIIQIVELKHHLHYDISYFLCTPRIVN